MLATGKALGLERFWVVVVVMRKEKNSKRKAPCHSSQTDKVGTLVNTTLKTLDE